MNMPKLLDGEIRKARDSAASYEPGFNDFQVDWSKARSDKRTGHMYGWTLGGEFLGQFTTHENALAAGARVSRLDHYWFLWVDEPKYAGHSNCGKPEWATCPECEGHVHHASCTARLDPKRDCCKRRGCKYALVN